MSSLIYSLHTQRSSVGRSVGRFVFPTAPSFQVLIDFVNVHIHGPQSRKHKWLRDIFSENPIKYNATQRFRLKCEPSYRILFRENDRSGIWVDVYGRACVCVSARIWVAVEIQAHKFGLLDHISVHINQVNAISICAEKKNKTANNAMQRATDASVCVTKSVLVGSWVFCCCCFVIFALCLLFFRLLQWNWIKYIHQYRCAISYLADTNTLQFSDRLSMLHLFHYIFDFILNANSFVYELFRIIRDL